MTKEEKKAIEMLESYRLNNSNFDEELAKANDVVLNLIKKQSKEIEDWKDVCHSLGDEQELEDKIKMFEPAIKALIEEGAKKEVRFLSKLTKYFKILLKEKKQIFEEMKRRNEKCD